MRYNRDGNGFSSSEEVDIGVSALHNKQFDYLTKAGGSGLGYLRNGNVLVCNLNPGMQDRGHFAELDLAAARNTSREFVVPPPSNTRIVSIALNPQGSRLAWMVRPKYEQPNAPGWFRRILYSMGFGASIPEMRIWLSEVDGSNMKELGVGHFPAWSFPWLGPMAWSPDGRKLAFASDHLLYVLPVN